MSRIRADPARRQDVRLGGAGLRRSRQLALTLLQAKADHELQLANVSFGATASNLDEDDYSGRLVE